MRLLHQDEFFFAVPYQVMDLCLYGKNHAYTPEEVASAAGLAPGRIKAIYQDIDRKRATTRYLHLSPLLVAPVPEVEDVRKSGRQAG